MTKELTIEDLTKEEILALCREYLFQPSPRHIRRVRSDSLAKKAKQIADKAQVEMDRYAGQPGVESRIAFLKASDKFDQAMELYKEAAEALKGKE